MDELTTAAGEQPGPADWPEPTWEARRAAYNREQDALEAYTMSRYVKEGHPYQLAIRSGLGTPYLKPGQYLMFRRINDSDQFWRMHSRMANELKSSDG